MGINVIIDEKLVVEAKKLTGLGADGAAVEEVLRQLFAGRAKHADLLALVGKVKFHDGYDPNELRRSKHDPDW